MTKVLYIGLDPKLVNLKDAALPPDLTVGKIAANIEAAMAQMSLRGWDAVFCGISDNVEEALTKVEACLAPDQDCVVIGSGVRNLKSQLSAFEKIVNFLRLRAPSTPIAFNTSPLDTADAAARWIRDGKADGESSVAT